MVQARSTRFVLLSFVHLIRSSFILSLLSGDVSISSRDSSLSFRLQPVFLFSPYSVRLKYRLHAIWYAHWIICEALSYDTVPTAAISISQGFLNSL